MRAVDVISMVSLYCLLLSVVVDAAALLLLLLLLLSLLLFLLLLLLLLLLLSCTGRLHALLTQSRPRRASHR